MSKVLFFAYGEHITKTSLALGDVKYEDLGKAKLKNARLCFKGIFMGVPTIEKVEGENVIGRLYEIDKKDFEVSKLKVTEGYLYTKVAMNVLTPKKEMVKAYTFIVRDIVNKNTTHRYNYIAPKRKIYRNMKRGYEELGLKIGRLEEAATYSLIKSYERDWYHGETGEEY